MKKSILSFVIASAIAPIANVSNATTAPAVSPLMSATIALNDANAQYNAVLASHKNALGNIVSSNQADLDSFTRQMQTAGQRRSDAQVAYNTAVIVTANQSTPPAPLAQPVIAPQKTPVVQQLTPQPKAPAPQAVPTILPQKTPVVQQLMPQPKAPAFQAVPVIVPQKTPQPINQKTPPMPTPPAPEVLTTVADHTVTYVETKMATVPLSQPGWTDPNLTTVADHTVVNAEPKLARLIADAPAPAISTMAVTTTAPVNTKAIDANTAAINGVKTDVAKEKYTGEAAQARAN